MPERSLRSQGNLIEVLNKPTPLIYALLFWGGGAWGRVCHTTSANTKFFVCLFRLVLGYCCDQLGEAYPRDIRPVPSRPSLPLRIPSLDGHRLVCYTAVFRVVTQRSSLWGGALRDARYWNEQHFGMGQKSCRLPFYCSDLEQYVISVTICCGAQLACVASVYSRVRRESWDEAKKKKKGRGRGRGMKESNRSEF